MKHIFVNLKRFDIPVSYGGVNRLAEISDWGAAVIASVQDALTAYDPQEAEFAFYLPEAHLLSALQARKSNSPVQIGAQSVYRADTSVGGNFGAFTSNRPAAAVKAMGCETVMIGHCEERNDLTGILSMAGVPADTITETVNTVLNQEILAAQARGLRVVYCIGEKSEEQENWQSVLRRQMEIGLKNADMSSVVIAYEPVWSIGPGKTPADKPYITKIACFLKEEFNGIDVVYGGGLKAENAEMLASIPEIDGGLIALTRFKGEIGFYPEEYLEIIRLYLGK